MSSKYLPIMSVIPAKIFHFTFSTKMSVEHIVEIVEPIHIYTPRAPPTFTHSTLFICDPIEIIVNA